MRSIARKRMLVWITVMTTGTLPFIPLACPSGATQETLLGNAYGTFGAPLVNSFFERAATEITRDPNPRGTPIMSALIDLLNMAAGQWVGMQIDRNVPDDPFP